MIKTVVRTVACSALLVCSFGAFAADWQREFFSPLTNELPPTRGAVVDDQGYLHLQAYNRAMSGEDYSLVHQYTIDDSGGIPWIWGLSQVDRMSDCGVYAKAGQRLDCSRRNGFWGDETRLEMRSATGSSLMWQSALPSDVTLLDASIPQHDQALALGRIESPLGTELGVFRTQSYAPADVLSVVPACPQSNQTLLHLRARMPQQPWEPLRVVKACWNSYGTTDLILDEFDLQTGMWQLRALWPLPFGVSVSHAEIGAQGQPYVLVEHDGGFRELLTATHLSDQWMPMPLAFPTQDKIVAFLVGQRGLTVVSVANSQTNTPHLDFGGEHTVSWFDTDGFWPIMHRFAELDAFVPKAFALSRAGDLLVVGTPRDTNRHSDRLLLARRDRQFFEIGDTPLAANESERGAIYLLGGPNNTALLARTIAQQHGASDTWIGVRANSYDLPPSFD